MPNKEKPESTQTLDDILWPDHPHATMHDAELLSLAIDYPGKRAALTLVVGVGDAGSDDKSARESWRPGKLLVEGLRYFSIEKPERFEGAADRKGLWIDADLGDPPAASFVGISEIPNKSSERDVRFWIFVKDWNSFMTIECERVEFVWSEAPKNGR